MIKRGLYLFTSVIVVFIILIVYWYVYDWEETVIGSKDRLLSSWHYELKEIDSEKAMFLYGITLHNDSNKPKLVRAIQPSYNSEFNIIEYDNVISVNKELQPNEKYKVNWNIVIDTKDISELNVKTVKFVLSSITIGINNSSHTYFQN